MVETLDAISDSANANFVKSQLQKHENRERVEAARYIIDAYENLGGEAIRSVAFKKVGIDRLLKDYLQNRNKNVMFSKAVRDKVKEQLWGEKEIEKDKAFGLLQDIFNIYGITEKVNLATLNKYGGATEQKGKDKKGLLKMWDFQPDFEFD